LETELFCDLIQIPYSLLIGGFALTRTGPPTRKNVRARKSLLSLYDDIECSSTTFFEPVIKPTYLRTAEKRNLGITRIYLQVIFIRSRVL